jgi:hypothetical protein
MSLEKLFIFSKDTDATEAMRGYEFQKLRALEAWLENHLLKNTDVIYCDYEEDIFQRDLDKWNSKFTQLKLYSSKNFSFGSVEVTKAISHFFMLFVKGEYKFDQMRFVFETNASVARQYLDNDAALLLEWKENQGELDVDLLKQCADKVRGIVISYAEAAGKGISDKDILQKIKDAKILLEEVPDPVWKDFASSIFWEFSDIPAEQAMKEVISRINLQISKIDTPAVYLNKENVFTRLYYAVSERSVQENPEDRKLDNAILDAIILDAGNEDDRGYNDDYQVWKNVKEIKSFRTAEFYKVYNLSYYCRYTTYLKHHAETWINLLTQYVNLAETPPYYRQKAIYELLWAKLRPNTLAEPDGSLFGYESLIREYFSKFQLFSDHESLEETAAMLGIVQGSVGFQKVEIDMEEVELWREQLLENVTGQIPLARDVNEACYLHAIAAMLILHNTVNPEDETILDDAFIHFDQILGDLQQAQRYDVRQLANRVSQFIKILIHLEHDIDEIERLEEYVDQLMPFVAKKTSGNQLAEEYISRGENYLNTTEPLSVLRALNYLHKAKTLLRHDQKRESYIFTLLSISQIYSLIGSNLAAKYYALSAARHATEHSDLHSKISDALSQVLYADFKQGAWISCIEDFRFFITSRGEYKSAEFDVEDKILMKSASEISAVFALSSRLHDRIGVVFDQEKKKMGRFYSEILGRYVDEFNSSYSNAAIPDFLKNKLDDAPLNDLGPVRAIRWNALGSSWRISFSNTWLGNSVGEEFMATLQILVTELGLSKIDLHLLQSNIEIKILLAEEWTEPLRERSNTIHKWTVQIPAIITEDYERIQMQPSYMVVCLKIMLNEISLLSKKELYDEIQNMLEKRDLAGKTLPDFLYQRLYRYLISESHFNEPCRGHFENIEVPLTPPTFAGLVWNDKTSPKYKKELSLEMIRERYQKALIPIHITLNKLKNDPRYPAFIQSVRTQGWLDWQITLALFNHTISYKVDIEMAGKKFTSANQQQKSVQQAFRKFVVTDEKENYISIPADYYFDGDFQFQLRQVALLTLENWSLDGKKSDFPNFEAVRHLMSKRFNFTEDDDISYSPL